MNTKFRWFRWALIAGLVVILTGPLWGPPLLKILEYHLSGQQFWDAIDQATPQVKAIADASLRAQGLNPDELIGEVFISQQGQEGLWQVDYWQIPPSDAYEKLKM